MREISQFLMAFGAICGIAAWFLYQKTLSRLILHLRTDHYALWEALGSPDADSPPHSSMANSKLRRFILRKQYEGNADIFIKNMGSLLRQRLLFSFFCLACLTVGIILFLLSATIV